MCALSAVYMRACLRMAVSASAHARVCASARARVRNGGGGGVGGGRRGYGRGAFAGACARAAPIEYKRAHTRVCVLVCAGVRAAGWPRHGCLCVYVGRCVRSCVCARARACVLVTECEIVTYALMLKCYIPSTSRRAFLICSSFVLTACGFSVCTGYRQ